MKRLSKSSYAADAVTADESVNESETIYEALPAMWHYQAAQLAVPIAPADEKGGLGCFGQD